jgi:hypothetical protein
LGLRKEKKVGQGREEGFGRFSKQISNNVFKTRFMFQTTLDHQYFGFVSYNSK